MENYFAAKAKTDQHLEDSEKKIDDALSDLREKGQALIARHDSILKRKRYLNEKDGESHVRGADMMKLNVGGKTMKIRRDTLSIIKGSRLENLFSGAWDERLLRDENSSIFMDIDPVIFNKIIEYLYLVKTVRAREEVDDLFPELPEVHPDQKSVFDAYIKFFRLRGGPIVEDDIDATIDINVSTTSCATQSSVESTHSKHEHVLDSLKKEEETLVAFEENLRKMEKKLEVEEDFFAFFTDARETGGEYVSVYSCDDKDGEGSLETRTGSDEEAVDSESTLVKLWLDGEIITVKHSTLCIYKQSLLAKLFSNEEWIKEHMFKNESGEGVIIVEQPPTIFKAIISKLRLCAMLRPNDEFPDIVLSSKEDMKMLDRVESLLLFGYNSTGVDIDARNISTRKWNPLVQCTNHSGTHSAADRRRWLMENKNLTLKEAEERVMQEFPEDFSHTSVFTKPKRWNPLVHCTDDSGTYSAADRRQWLMENKNLTLEEAEERVMQVFPDVFGI